MQLKGNVLRTLDDVKLLTGIVCSSTIPDFQLSCSDSLVLLWQPQGRRTLYTLYVLV